MRAKDRKIIFVIVEGGSENAALSIPLTNIFNLSDVVIHVYGGDITLQRSSDIERVMAKIIEEFAGRNHLKREDFLEILHIIDTDGVFIPDTSVIQAPAGQDHVIYNDFEIIAPNKNGIIDRNRTKRATILRLIKKRTIWKIPYRMAFMSCNLDHVIKNDRMATEGRKKTNSDSFADYFRDKPDKFIKFMCSSKFSVAGEYNETWEFIQEDHNSLHRHTNLPVIFAGYPLREDLQEILDTVLSKKMAAE